MSQTPVALVTGSSRGIGRAIAVELARAGYDIAVHCRANREGAKTTADEIHAAGRRSEVFAADLASPAARSELVEKVKAAFPTLDVLVNNAGAAPKVRADLLDLEEDEFDDTFDTNFRGAFFLTRDIANWMLETRDAEPERRLSIVNISSVSEYAPTVNRAAYCVAKAGLGMMTKLFAVRLAAANIPVNAVRPGIIDTDMTGPVKAKYDQRIAEGLTPLRRWGQPEDVARAVRALVRGDFDFATGSVVDLDGGFHIREL